MLSNALTLAVPELQQQQTLPPSREDNTDRGAAEAIRSVHTAEDALSKHHLRSARQVQEGGRAALDQSHSHLREISQMRVDDVRDRLECLRG